MHLFNGMGRSCPWSITQRPSPDNVRISQRRYIPASQLLPDWAVDLNARSHPRGERYPAPAAARALAHALERPGSVITGFSALAVYGLPYLVEGHDTTLCSPVASSRVGGALTPTVVRRGSRPSDVWTVYVRGFPFRVASPAAATVQALRRIKNGHEAWSTVAGLDPLTARAAQLIDAARRHLDVTPELLRRGGHYQLNNRWLGSMLGMSSALADSPKETEMRLLLAPVAEQFGFSLREQVPVRRGSLLVTTFDLALLEARVGLMYDGQHHWEYQQRQKDSSINLEVTSLGWTPLRFTAGTLPELPERLVRLLSAKSHHG